MSTRGGTGAVSFSEAVLQGLAPDGGLFVPEEFPSLGDEDFPSTELKEVAKRILRPFLEADPLAERLDALVSAAFSFPVPLVEGGPAPRLELFHGPTAAFKDVGARFLARCVAALEGSGRTVLVATSGDTGSAVAAAFEGLPGIEVVVLYPAEGVSREQERLLTCWGEGVRAFAVSGSFDDCQAILKQALGDRELFAPRLLTTANSINLARLLGQVVYYAHASLVYRRRTERSPTFVVPTGNLGNATACLWASRCGLPIRGVVLATNANRVLVDFLAGDDYEPRPSIQTLANAMDVGAPSNLERVLHLFGDEERFRQEVAATSCDDESIRRILAAAPARWGTPIDPHTATAVHAFESLDIPDPILVSTAHPAKFLSVVQPLVERPIETPPSLRALWNRPCRVRPLAPSVHALAEALSS